MEGEAERIDLPTEQEHHAATKVSMLGSAVLFMISAVVGLYIDSITLILDASASLVILAVAFLMKISLKKVQSPPDGRFNFGYGKYEPLTLAVQGGLIISTCVVSMKFAVQDILHPDDVEHYGIALVATFVSGMIGIFVTVCLKAIARRTHSRMIDTASLHWLADTLLSFGVCAGFLFGFVLQSLGYHRITPYVDPAMAIALALILIRMPIRVIIHNVFELLDAVPPEDLHSRITKLVGEYARSMLGIHRLRIRKAGERVFVDVCFLVESDSTVSQMHQFGEGLERDLKELVPIVDVVVCFKPH
ncbi:MAG: cation diffusion facilitator family transporter [Deltaproteobacteria bacterium]|nr:cation diffusion facilitator family transporter [Deltaproteobacteria bacterium]